MKPEVMSPQVQNRRRIALVCPRVVSTFISEDVRALSARFEVELLPDRGPRGLSSLGRAIRGSDAVLMWFLGRHAVPAILFAQRFRKPIISIIGGFEVAWVPELNYGIRPGSIRERALRWMLRHSDRIIVVSDRSREDALERFPELGRRMHRIYNAVDTSKFSYSKAQARNGVISVGRINRVTLGIKSWRLIRETAIRMPDVQFAAVGPADDAEGRDFVNNLPSNLVWRGSLEHDALPHELQRASVYIQASVYESFCVALAEGMACGCIPVIAPTGALPEVGGPSAIVMKDLSAESAEEALRKGLMIADSARAIVRDHITQNFSFESRREQLAALLNDVMGDTKITPT